MKPRTLRLPPLSRTRAFRILVYVLLTRLILWVGSQLGFIFEPLATVAGVVGLPIVLAGILYYLLVPLVDLIDRTKLPRRVGIGLVFLVLAVGVVLVAAVLIPSLLGQIEAFAAGMPRIVEEVQNYLRQITQDSFLANIPQIASLEQDLPSQISELLLGLYESIGADLSGLVAAVTNIVIVLMTVPFLLYFMLRDGKRLPGLVVRVFPDRFKPEALETVGKMGRMLGAYIKGQVIVAALIGVVLLIGYLIFDVRFALLLALLAFLINFIPYIGPAIGTLSGVLVALMDSPGKMIGVLIFAFIAQQLKAQLVAPLVLGNQMRIHPVVVILLLIGAGSVGGFLGLVAAVPAYALIRTAAPTLYKLVNLRKEALIYREEDEP